MPALATDKVLYIGIVVSMVLRAVCIAAGAAALTTFNWVFYAFGAFLVYTAAKLLLAGRTTTPTSTRGGSCGWPGGRSPDRIYEGTRLAVRDGGRRRYTPLVW